MHPLEFISLRHQNVNLRPLFCSIDSTIDNQQPIKGNWGTDHCQSPRLLLEGRGRAIASKFLG